MLTASVVTYHTSLPEISAVLDCALQSPVDKLYIIDNSRNDALAYFGETISENPVHSQRQYRLRRSP